MNVSLLTLSDCLLSIAGQSKGQGQEKQVLINRDHKNVHKASRANHNRRIASQRKRQQGMIP